MKDNKENYIEFDLPTPPKLPTSEQQQNQVIEATKKLLPQKVNK